MSEDDRKLVELLQATYTVRDEFSVCRPLCNPDGLAAAARITELSEQVEAKDARIAELEVKLTDEGSFAEQCLDRALAAESALAKAQGEVERLRGALEAVASDRLGDQAWSHARAALKETSDGQ